MLFILLYMIAIQIKLLINALRNFNQTLSGNKYCGRKTRLQEKGGGKGAIINIRYQHRINRFLIAQISSVTLDVVRYIQPIMTRKRRFGGESVRHKNNTKTPEIRFVQRVTEPDVNCLEIAFFVLQIKSSVILSEKVKKTLCL